MMVLTIQRLGEPNQFDQFPCGTLCKVIKGAEGAYVLYKQMSEDENAPIWKCIEEYVPAITATRD